MEKKTIYMIEDEGLICDLFRDYVELFDDLTHAGYCQSGGKAMEKLREVKPDIVVVDIRLPEQSGLALVPEIRKELPECKIILFTGTIKEEAIQTALKHKVEAYVEKSFGFEELKNAIQAVLKDETYLSPGVAKIIRNFTL